MKTSLRIFLILLIFIILAFIRFRESDIFYDPLTQFFKGDFLVGELPEMDDTKLWLHLFFRFLINTLLSLLILWIAFEDHGIIKFSIWLFAIVFIVLFPCYVILLQTSETDLMPLFYVRRFLIQPLFVLILLPAFYYYKRQSK